MALLFGSRRVVLAVLVVALVPAFAFTALVVGRYKDERQRLAVEWRDRGAGNLSHQPAIAVADYETALSYLDDPDDRFRLAQALVGASRFAEARAQLLTLWIEEPGDGRVNLELARLAVRSHDENEAVRYYHAAIDGAWESGAPAARRTARLELAKFLLSSGQNLRAQAELIAMIDDLPKDAALITDVGSLLVAAGADARAMNLFQRALTIAPEEPRAARLAGGVAFRAGNYQLAHQYWTEAATKEPLDPASQDGLAIATRVLALDPTVPHLSTRSRAARTLLCIAIAHERFDRCQPEGAAMADLRTDIEELQKVHEGDLIRDPDLIDTTMPTVFKIEGLPASSCGQPTVDDRALQLLSGQRHTSTR